MADLTNLTDAELDTMLATEYADHHRAMCCGDKVEANACHILIVEILAEQSRRLDAWIEAHLKEPACRT
jgi:hypothetical protein